ncbi:MAG: GntR family transcriptional regulator [Lapillicoccus sp.]
MTAATLLPRSKTSEAVAEFLLGEYLAGRIRPGDRIDLDRVASDLGVSRAPVREALILLERDGSVRMPFHRGAFMGDIDAAAVREGFTLYALLSGLTAELTTEHGDAETVAALGVAADHALASRSAMEYEVHAREFRRLVNTGVAGPHLRSMLRTFNGLVVAVSGIAIEAGLGDEQRLLAAELAAIRAGERGTAGAAAIDHVRATGERGIGVLVDRGVLAESSAGDAGTGDEPAVSTLGAIVARVARVAAAGGAR